jgi:glycosyltransferase involved in cell wall biosynthesis
MKAHMPLSELGRKAEVTGASPQALAAPGKPHRVEGGADVEICVSVVVPVFNGADYVVEALHSVLAQTYPPLECIVVDDGSTDATAELVRQFGSAVRYERLDHAGVSAARNRGAVLSQGNYIAFLDHDDKWRPDKLARQAALLREGNADMALCALQIVDCDDRPLRVQRLRVTKELVEGMLLWDGTEVVSCSSTALVRRQAFLSLGGFDQNLSTSADWDFLLRFALERTVGYLDEPLVSYRIHRNNMSRDVGLMQRDMLRAYGKAFANPHLPEVVRARRRLAYSRLWWMLAGSHGMRSAYRDAISAAVQGIAMHPSFATRATRRIVASGYVGLTWRVHELSRRSIELAGHRLAELGERRACASLIYNPVIIWGYHKLARRDADPTITAIADLFPGAQTYLDVGAGGGAFAAAVSRRGLDALALERSAIGRLLTRRQGVKAKRFDLSHGHCQPPGAFDLAYCFEVAEHMSPELGDRLVDYLARSAPIVIFTAARPGQGGYGHINEQPAEYWITRFAAHDLIADTALTTRLQQLLVARGVAASWLITNILVLTREQTAVDEREATL